MSSDLDDLETLMSGLTVDHTPSSAATNDSNEPLRMDALLTWSAVNQRDPSLPRTRRGQVFPGLPLTSTVEGGPSIEGLFRHFHSQAVAPEFDPSNTTLTLGRSDCWLTSSRPGITYGLIPILALRASELYKHDIDMTPKLISSPHGGLSDADKAEREEATRRWQAVLASGSFAGQNAAGQEEVSTWAQSVHNLHNQLLTACQKLQQDPNNPEGGITFQRVQGPGVFGA